MSRSTGGVRRDDENARERQVHVAGSGEVRRVLLLAAGFELKQESDLLANPADDRTKMVFAPGTRGTTDQAFFIFRKPD